MREGKRIKSVGYRREGGWKEAALGAVIEMSRQSKQDGGGEEGQTDLGRGKETNKGLMSSEKGQRQREGRREIMNPGASGEKAPGAVRRG